MAIRVCPSTQDYDEVLADDVASGTPGLAAGVCHLLLFGLGVRKRRDELSARSGTEGPLARTAPGSGRPA
jgi:hypothetical protein